MRSSTIVAVACALLGCGLTTPSVESAPLQLPPPSALTARIRPAPEQLRLDSASGRYVLAPRAGTLSWLRAGADVSIDVARPALELRASAGRPGLRLTYSGGPLAFGPGVRREGSVVYAGAGAALVLTPGTRGVKEDVMLSRPIGDALTLKWTLSLDPELQATLEPDGSIGVHRALTLERVYELPAPVLRDATGVERRDLLRFELEGAVIRLVATGLAGLAYPVDLDPTVVTTSPEFALGGNLESDVVNISDQLSRAPATATVGAWSSTTSFPTARSNHTSVVANGFLYVLGGLTGGGPLNDVRFAAFNPGGQVGNWSSTTAFTTPRSRQGSVVYNGYLYIAGGFNGAQLSDVQVAKVNASGTLGAWASTTPLPAARSGFGMVAYNGYVYVIGGSPVTNSVLYAPVNPDGSLGGWVATNTLLTARHQHASAVLNGFIYAVGGTTGVSTELADVEFARLAPDGSVGPWSVTTPLAGARKYHALTAASGALIMTGGADVFGDTRNGAIAAVLGNGTLGAWVALPNDFATARSGHSSVVANGLVYVIGGSGVGTYNDVQLAPLDANGVLGGTLGAWSATTPFPNARWGHASVYANGYLYVISGVDSASMYLSDVQYSKVGDDGRVGSWVAGTSISPPRQLFAATAYNNFIYVSGGNAGTLNDVRYAPINADGSLGAWSLGGTFTTARYGHASAAYNGHLYIFGGANSADVKLNDVQVATINLDGSLGPFSATTAFPIPRYNFGGVVHNGSLYVVGGALAMYGSFVTDVSYAPIAADGAVGPWTATSPLPLERAYQATLAYNGSLYVLGGFYMAAFRDEVYRAGINANGTVGAWSLTTALPQIRSYPTAIGANGYVYIIGGYAGVTYNSIVSAPVLGPMAVGQYSRLFDLGSSLTLDTITVRGSASNQGSVRLAYRTSLVASSFGALVDEDLIPLGQPVSTPVSARYLWLRLTLDDTANASATSGGQERDIDDVTISFLLPDGNVCAAGPECLSGQCVDGVCCNVSCGGSCNACDVLGSVGTCTNRAAGSPGSPSCAPYVCAGASACPASCASDAQCDSSSYCGGSLCVAKKPSAASCMGANQCISGQCADGVCCDSGCGAACDACNLGGFVGVCTALPVGAVGTPSCTPYLCGGASACPSSCSLDSQCVTSSYCNGTACVPKQANGASCAGASQCVSGQCIDGVCCNTACGAACDACDLPLTVGTCTPVPPGSAGSPSCTPFVCGGGVACPTTCTVDTECVPTAYCLGTVCTPKRGPGITCSGANQCASNQCVDGVCCNTSCSGACDTCDQVGSLGTCTFAPRGSVGTPACAPLLCTGNLVDCPTSCVDDSSCLAGQYCEGSVCQGRLDPGFACAMGKECVSGHCVDGVCCDTACAGACDACNLAGSAGACTAVTPGSPGAPSCAPLVCAGGASCPTSCAGDAQCTSSTYCVSGACLVKQASGAACTGANQCASGFCADGVCCQSLCGGACEACDGLGSRGVCTAAAAGSVGAPSCSPYTCGGASTCSVSCGADAECVASTVCRGGLCVPPPELVTHHYGVGCGCGASGESGLSTFAVVAVSLMASQLRRARRSGRRSPKEWRDCLAEAENRL